MTIWFSTWCRTGFSPVSSRRTSSATSAQCPTVASAGPALFRLFRELCDAFSGLGQGDLDDPFTAKPFRYLHKDVELQDYPAIPGAAWHVGHQGALQWTTNLWESFEDFRLEPQEFNPGSRGRYVCITDTVGQDRRSGVEISLTAYAVVTVEEGRIRRIAITTDRQEALEAAGSSE